MSEVRTTNLIEGLGGLATYLGKHRNTIINWKKKRLLNYTKVGGTIFFDPENLFAESKKTSPRKK